MNSLIQHGLTVLVASVVSSGVSMGIAAAVNTHRIARSEQDIQQINTKLALHDVMIASLQSELLKQIGEVSQKLSRIEGRMDERERRDRTAWLGAVE